MKKLFALLLALGMILCLAACQKTVTEEPKTDDPAAGADAGENAGSYADLSIIPQVQLGREEYGIAFRTGSDLVAKVDELSAGLFADGTIAALGEKYGLSGNLVSEFVPSSDSAPSGESDLAYVQDKGVMIIGVTDFDPMDYRDENGKWIGFDAEYAEAICAKLGVKAEFKEIEWDSKELELQTKAIDCIWNGMTITDAICEAADVTGAYMLNYQVVVVKDAEAYPTLESLKGKTVVAESGSAGESAAKDDENLSVGYKAVPSQADALLQVKSGAAEACVIDFVMADSLVGKK